ncbi:hypothetical protein [Viridibacterium curvum]|uniref:hypothetical protein n=1 Tax=Viridibacterium curvum TaxID=1101404 RepID=UPI0031E95349
MDRWQQYLFEAHPEATLRNWARRLQKFRFFRAYGGHANDGDSLDVCYAYQDTGELQEFFAHLGVKLVMHETQPPQPEPDVSYPGDVYAAFPSLIPGTRWIEQPRYCVIDGHKVFAWCEVGKIRLSIGMNYEVTPSDVTVAEAIERLLENVSLTVIEPPIDNRNCICPKFYPGYFS